MVGFVAQVGRFQSSVKVQLGDKDRRRLTTRRDVVSSDQHNDYVMSAGDETFAIKTPSSALTKL